MAQHDTTAAAPRGAVPFTDTALIFATGAVTLSLEVLTSRVMTPYFGVSLYIWSGILSITLVFLAVGYRLGGRWSEGRDPASLATLFLGLPIAASIAVTAATAVYPVFFPWLAGFDLVIGSFVAGAVLLALPLVALSAMNPLLIAMARQSQTGDGGAGRVFFISTIGSVAGVLITAFLFIPNQTNFRAILMLAIGLAVVSAGLAAIDRRLPGRDKRRLAIGAAIAVVLGAGLLIGQKTYLGSISTASGPYDYSVRAEYTSLFGNVKVLDARPTDPRLLPFRAYVQDGMVQNRTTLQGQSLSLYTHALETLGRAFEPDAKTAVVLGLGAGIVPAALQRRGVTVDVVEINRDSLAAARDHFGFAPEQVGVHLEDARTFVHRCRNRFDLAMIDLFHGDGTPDYLLTVEFFRDVARCLKPGGSAIMNAFFDGRDEAPNRRLLVTVAAAFPQVFEFRDRSGDGSGAGYNGFIVATTGEAPGRVAVDLSTVPPPLQGVVQGVLSSGRRVDPRALSGAQPVTDDHNVFTILNAATFMSFRRAYVGFLPVHALVN